MILPKLILTDVDGVWTDGGMYYDNFENEFKKFNTYDSAGVLYCRFLNIPVGIITGERTAIVERRAKKLGITILHQGVNNKLVTVRKITDELKLRFNEVAYMGDDFNDYHLLKNVGIGGCPNNAADFIKKVCGIVTKKKGGEGASREFVETILIRSGVYEQTLNAILRENFVSENFDQ